MFRIVINIFFCFLLLNINLFAQKSKVDSLLTIGNNQLKKNNIDAALQTFLKVEKLARKNDLKPQLYQTYQSLTKLYSRELDYVLAFDYQKKAEKINEQLHEEELTQKIAEAEKRISDRFKNKPAKQQKKEPQKQIQLDDKNNTIPSILFVVLLIGLLLVVIGLIFYVIHIRKNFSLKINNAQQSINNAYKDDYTTEINNLNAELHKTKLDLAKQNDVVLKLNSDTTESKKIETLEKLISEQKINFEKTIALQKQEIENNKNSNINITPDIEFAKHIEKTQLPLKSFITHLFGKNFVYHNPKNSLAQSSYWFDSIDGKIYFATINFNEKDFKPVFINLIVNQLLNKAVHEFAKEKPAEILRFINQEIRNWINPTTAKKSTENGISISLCCFNIHTNELEFSGANNSIYIVRKNIHEEIVLHEIQGNIEPIAKTKIDANFAFTNQLIEIKTGDRLFLSSNTIFTDVDFDKKINAKKLQQLLIQNNTKPIQELESLIDSEFKNSNHNTNDDVLLIGLEF